MPELPEVETVRRGLKSFILSQKIQKIQVLCAKSFIGQPITGQIQDIRRFGKALVIDLDNGYSLMIHLRMTGQLIYDGKERYAAGHPSENFIDQLPNQQTRVIIKLTNGTLYFNDQRKFGFIKIIPTLEVKQDKFIQKLAKEPWQMTAAELHAKLQKHQKSTIKSAILDQTIICGLGNIYADEALYKAKIHPARKAGTLSPKETKNLLTAAKQVMEKSIASGGSTIRNYVKADGTRGNYLDAFANVYHKDGQACTRCGTTIVKTKIAGRGTHFCPKCQQLKEVSNA
ncbi:DNA-formamidopyrimidine glycosylase [Candidatus Saccharibacteria bacterium]|nr:DNA-formamidopyrimidine glycosylase [Candidatus Saccharibacteria bacterium]